MYFNTLDASTGHSGQDGFSFKYENGTWSDIGVHVPFAFTNTSTYVNQTSVADGEYIYLWASSTECRARFVSPYYEAPSTPTVVSPLPVLSQHTQTFGMEYYQTVGTKYYYKSDSHSGTGTSITYDYETKTWNDEGSQVPYHLNTTSTFASTTSLVNPAEIHGFGSQQNHNGTRYFSVSNPYYEALPTELEQQLISLSVVVHTNQTDILPLLTI
jgi:hypothetical protein